MSEKEEALKNEFRFASSSIVALYCQRCSGWDRCGLCRL